MDPSPDDALSLLSAHVDEMRGALDEGRWLEVLRLTGMLEDDTIPLRVELIREARAQGARWSDVGAALGISLQAAQKRYGPLLQSREQYELARSASERRAGYVPGPQPPAGARDTGPQPRRRGR